MTIAESPRIIHITLGSELGGMPEIVRAEQRELRRRGFVADWIPLSLPQRYADASAAISAWLHDRHADSALTPDQVHDALNEWALEEAPRLLPQIDARDVIVLHDPVPLALAPHLTKGRLFWRSHVGARNTAGRIDLAARALDRVLAQVEGALVYDRDFLWPGLPTVAHTVVAGIDVDDIKLRDLPPHPVLTASLLTTGRSNRSDRPWSTPVLDDQRTGFLPAPDTPFLLQVGRWDPLKGHLAGLRSSLPVLEESEAHYVALGPEIRDTLMGSTNRQVLNALLRLREQQSDQVARRIHVWTFTGSPPSSETHREAINRVRTAASIVTNPSIEEGFGLATAEAMYSRCCVVASPVGGHLQQITDGYDGFLREPDHPAWAVTVAELLDDVSLRRTIGERARTSVTSRYSAAQAVDRFLDIIELEREPWSASHS